MAAQYSQRPEQISIADWEATPPSVKQLVSSLLAQKLTHTSTTDITKEKDNRLSQFLDAASVGIAVHDATGDLVYINQAGQELLTNISSSALKVERVEKLPQAFHIFRSTTQQPYPPKELPSYLALAGEKVRAEDLEVHCPDRTIPLEVMANPMFDSQGRVEYVIATFQDITARRSSEQALQKSNILYQQVVEAQTDFIVRSLPDTTITFANPTLCCALGFSVEEVIGLKWIDFANPEELQSCLQKVTELTPENSSFLKENRNLWADGTITWTEWRNQGIFNSQGELVEIQSVGRDITTLKQTEIALQESETRLQNIAANIPGVVARYLLGADGSDKLYYMSPGCYDLWGIEAQVAEANVKILWDMTHPEDISLVYEALKLSAQTLQTWSSEWRMTLLSGQQKWLWGVGKPELTQNGDVVWDMLILDISERAQLEADRKQVELELYSQKQLLQLIFDNMPVMAGIYSPTGEILMTNPCLEQITGWTKDEYQTVDVLRESFPDLADYKAVIQNIIKADSTWNDCKMRVKDGRILETTWMQMPLTDGRSMSFGRDITEQKYLLASLTQMNQELETRVAQRTAELQHKETILEESQRVARLGSWELIVATGEVFWTPELFHIFGYDPGQPALSYTQQSRNFAPEEWQRLTHLVDRAINHGEPYEADLQIIREDGSLGYIFAKGQPTLDEEGQVQRLVGIGMDISDRKLAEAQILQTSQQLAATNKELETFAYSVSHDLRAPLRAIDGFSKALIEDYGDKFDEEAKDYFSRIDRAIGRMENLIDSLLGLSRVSRTEIQRHRVNLTRIVEEITTELRASQPDREVNFVITPGAIAYADSNLIRIALENLLQNAWKFTSHHPTARIEFGITQIQEVQAPQAPREIIYFIRDDGAGFDIAFSTMLFGVFQRLHNTNEFPGTGIGLATVQRVINRHGGRIWAEGAVEAGATLYFTLPDKI